MYQKFSANNNWYRMILAQKPKIFLKLFYFYTIKFKILKQFIVILLSVILMLPSFGNIIVYTKFKINQDEIAKTICIQRKMAKNSCNGRCDLLKSLKKFEDNEKKMNSHLKEKTELVYISTILEAIPTIVTPVISTAKNYNYFDKKPISVVLSNFRPPAYFI